MKIMNINKLSVLAVSLLLALFTSCSIIEDVEYNVVQNPLQMHGGDVTLQINGNLLKKD